MARFLLWVISHLYEVKFASQANIIKHLSSLELINGPNHFNYFFKVWDLSRLPSYLVLNFFVVFLDDYSRMTWLYLMKGHYELYFSIAFYFKLIVIWYIHSMLRTNNARESFFKTFELFLLANGILHNLSCSYTSQQKRVARTEIITLSCSYISVMNHFPQSCWVMQL